MSTTTLLLQLIVILGTARACGWLLRHVGQPSVVGEMAAGLVLGPVVMGALLPGLHGQLFAPGSLAGLSSLATLGLVLFMFVVGLELRAHEGVAAQIRAAGFVGLLSMAGPLALGLAIEPHCTLRWRRPASASGPSRCSWPWPCRSPRSR